MEGVGVLRGMVLSTVGLLLAGIMVILGGSSPGEGSSEVAVLNPGGPALIPVAGILGGQVSGDLPLRVSVWRTQEEALGRLQGDPRLYAVLPLPLGVALGSRSDLVLLAVHEWRVFSLVVSPSLPFEGLASLKGKELYMAQGRGTTLDALVRFLLLREGVDPERDLRLIYAPPQEIVALFRQGSLEAAALPEPFTTLCLAPGKGHVALDLQEVWQQATGGRVPVAGLFAHRDRLREAPEEGAEVCRIMALSTAWGIRHPSEACAVLKKLFDTPEEPFLLGWDRMTFSWEPTDRCSRDVEIFFQTLHRTLPGDFSPLPSGVISLP